MYDYSPISLASMWWHDQFMQVQWLPCIPAQGTRTIFSPFWVVTERLQVPNTVRTSVGVELRAVSASIVLYDD